MEDTGYEFSQVHVLRHSFRPNAFLSKQFEEIAPGAQAPYVIYGSDERVIPLFDVGLRAFQSQSFNANAKVERNSHGNFQLESGLDAHVLISRRKGAVALRLVMNVFYTAQYKELLSVMNDIKVGERAYAPGLYTTQLYVDMPFSKLAPEPSVRKSVTDFRALLKDKESRRQYQVFSAPQLSSLTAQRRITSPPSVEGTGSTLDTLPHP